MDKEWFRRRLDELRNERGWSKLKLNEESGFSEGMIYQWYNTNRVPTIGNVEAICKACHISLSEFFAFDKNDRETITDYEFSRLYAKLSLEEKIFVREMAERLLKLKKNANGQKDE